MSLDEILKDVGEYLEWQRDEGERTLTLPSAVVDELGRGESGGAPESRTAAVSTPRPERSADVAQCDSLEAVAEEIAQCTACPLHEACTRTVPGQGNPRPDILFVGEAPGADEDRQGLAFVGRAGQLLAKMIDAMGYTRDDVFIANINKCRPPGNRAPTPAEMDTCLPYLKRQIAILNPKVIVAMGATAVKGLIEVPKGLGITKIRGQWHTFEGIDLMPTFHPAYMLRNPNMKRPVWEDLKTVLRHLGKPIPPVKKP